MIELSDYSKAIILKKAGFINNLQEATSLNIIILESDSEKAKGFYPRKTDLFNIDLGDIDLEYIIGEKSYGQRLVEVIMGDKKFAVVKIYTTESGIIKDKKFYIFSI